MSRSPRTLYSALLALATVAAPFGCGSETSTKTFNTAPGVSITQPGSGSEYDEGEVVSFLAVVDDDQESPEELSLTWTSDVDGLLDNEGRADGDGFVQFTTANLSPGNHVITLKVVDGDAASGEDFVDLSVLDVPDAPEIAMVHPISGEYGIEDEDFEFVALVSDEQDDPGELLVTMTSDADGEFCAPEPDLVGVASCEFALSAGAHVLTYTVVDLDGNEASTTAYFEIIPGSEVDHDEDSWTESEGDCDDSDPSVYPGADEYPNGIDDDCDGEIDEDTVTTDDDGDGYSELDGDCDDADDGVYPDAPETCDDVDNDCDDVIDDGTSAFDDDGDCYCESGTCAGSIRASCTSVVAGDCDDDDEDVSPAETETCNGVDDDCDGSTDEGVTSTWYADTDGDGYGDAGVTSSACSAPTGYVSNDDDCDDDAASVSPAGTESCNEVDDDCDGSVEEGVTTTYYADDDDDGYGDASSSVAACSAPTGTVLNDDDCDDSDDAISPAGTEVCDDDDNDCDGTVDEASATDAATWYYDGDEDGYGRTTRTSVACDAPDGYVALGTDCNDANDAINPGATEVCDSKDNDCDGTTDEADASDVTTWYRDADGDGYGVSSTTSVSCSAPTGYVATSGDCNDGSSSISPGATEICDSVDNDCDGYTDEGVTTTYYRDADGDGYGTSATSKAACSAPVGYVASSTDCDDTDATLSPATVWYIDYDGDGYGSSSRTATQCAQPSGYVSNDDDCNDSSSSAYPGATETCDSADNDCDGYTDEEDASGCTTYYYDYDGDGYGSKTVTGKCMCAASGYYDSRYNTDCYDSNSSANPAATSYYSVSRGDGSYDYNCDGSQSKYYGSKYSCDDFWSTDPCGVNNTGWLSSVPSCGSSSTYVTDCDIDWFSCTNTTTTRTQSCR